MDLGDYQKESRKTVSYPYVGSNYIYPALGLAGEAGEMLNQVKKIVRDDGSQLTEERKQLIQSEMGDMLWYLAQLATELEVDLNEVANENLKKTKEIYKS
jgi:NTP pyrophosphatase (non-canonical NTP hydrolase)